MLYNNNGQDFFYKIYHFVSALGDQQVAMFYHLKLSHPPPLFETMSFNKLSNLFNQSLLIPPTLHYFHPPLRFRLNSFSSIPPPLLMAPTSGAELPLFSLLKLQKGNGHILMEMSF